MRHFFMGLLFMAVGAAGVVAFLQGWSILVSLQEEGVASGYYTIRLYIPVAFVVIGAICFLAGLGGLLFGPVLAGDSERERDG